MPKERKLFFGCQGRIAESIYVVGSTDSVRAGCVTLNRFGLKCPFGGVMQGLKTGTKTFRPIVMNGGSPGKWSRLITQMKVDDAVGGNSSLWASFPHMGNLSEVEYLRLNEK